MAEPTTETNEETLYFQYVSDLNYPVFLSFSQKEFNKEEMAVLLENLNFSPKDEAEVDKVRGEDPQFRILKIKIASGRLVRQIQTVQVSDRFGPERIDQGNGFNIYRYKNTGLMVYSFRSPEWELGVLEDFASDPTSIASRVVVNRYLSWALSQVGVCGIWGVAVDNSMVVSKVGSSQGECVFFDLENQKVITQDGIQNLDYGFQFIRLDATLKDKTIEMSREQLLSFLPMHCTYFSTNFLSVPIRQMISRLALSVPGVIYPASNFVPRNRVFQEI